MLSKRPRIDAGTGTDENTTYGHQSSVFKSSADDVKHDQVNAWVLAGIDTCRRNGVLCDVRLFAEDSKFSAHKVVLASSSGYFKEMFTSEMVEQANSVVTMTGVNADQLRVILDFMYTGTISITNSNVESILSAANYLQVATLRDMCCLFLKNQLDKTNCLRIVQIAGKCACRDLEDEAMKVARNVFKQAMHQDEFLELSAGKLTKLISSDNLNIKMEEDLFEAVVSWLNHKPEERTQGFEKIFQHIRLALMNPYYLLHKVATTPAVKGNKKCRQWLKAAKHLHMLPDRRREYSTVCAIPRINSLVVTAAILVGGQDGRSCLQDVDCFVPTQDTWLSLAKLPCEIYQHGVAAIDQNSLLLAGGVQGHMTTSAAWSFNPALNSWCKAAPMIAERRHVSLAALDGFVYAVGAPSEEFSVERYNPVVNQWDPVREMKIKLLQYAVATSLGGKLFVSGVFKDGDNMKGCIQSYDPYTDSWQEVSSSLPSLYYSSSCVCNQKLYLIGGWDPVEKKSSRSVICFDPKTTTWSECEPMEEARASPGVAVIAFRIFVFGGSKHVEKQLGMDTMEVYDLETNKWLGKKTMERERCWHGCVTLNIPTHMLQDKAAKE